MSLMVHPAPLITRAPSPNRANNWRSGKDPGEAASPMLHVHGKYNNHVPIGLSKRIKRKYGCTAGGQASTIDAVLKCRRE